MAKRSDVNPYQSPAPIAADAESAAATGFGPLLQSRETSLRALAFAKPLAAVGWIWLALLANSQQHVPIGLTFLVAFLVITDYAVAVGLRRLRNWALVVLVVQSVVMIVGSVVVLSFLPVAPLVCVFLIGFRLAMIRFTRSARTREVCRLRGGSAMAKSRETLAIIIFKAVVWTALWIIEQVVFFAGLKMTPFG